MTAPSAAPDSAASANAPSAHATPYGTLPPASPLPQRRPVSLPRLAQMREAGEKITMLTAYDATFAAVADAAGVDCILVGEADSHAILDRSLERGVNFIDTAEMYAVPAGRPPLAPPKPSSATGLPSTPGRGTSWCWPARWPGPRAACHGFARAKA